MACVVRIFSRDYSRAAAARRVTTRSATRFSNRRSRPTLARAAQIGFGSTMCPWRRPLDIGGPVTIGFSQKLVLLPANMLAALSEDDLAHRHRARVRAHAPQTTSSRIFSMSCCPCLSAIIRSFGSPASGSRRRREMVCDEMAGCYSPEGMNTRDSFCGWHPCSSRACQFELLTPSESSMPTPWKGDLCD